MLASLEFYALLSSLGMSVLVMWLLALRLLFRSFRPFQSKDRALNHLSRFGFMVITGALLCGLICRGIFLERFPLANLYESLLFFALGIALIFTILYRHFVYLTLPGVITIAGILIAAFFLPESQKSALPLIPALRSYWRIIHVPPLLVSYAFFMLAAFTGGVYLITEWRFRGSLAEKTSKLSFYQEGIYRSVAFGFPLLTFGIITGAIWANQSWGNLWQWDPKENLALATWFCYAAYLHLRMSGKASEQVLAWISILGILATYMTYIGINQFDLGGLHTYGKV